MKTRQERVATDIRISPGCRTTSLEHWSKRKPTVEPRWAKQQTKKLRPKPIKYYDKAKIRTRQERVVTDTWRSPGCRTAALEHWSKMKQTVEPRWAKQQTKKLRPKPTKINSFMSGPSSSLTPDPAACNERGKQSY